MINILSVWRKSVNRACREERDIVERNIIGVRKKIKSDRRENGGRREMKMGRKYDREMMKRKY